MRFLEQFKKINVFKEHFVSFLNTFITDLLWDAAIGTSFTHIFVEKDFSKTALYALGYAIFRTLVRLIRSTYFKKPIYEKTEIISDFPKN